MQDILTLKHSRVDTLPHISMDGESAARILTPSPDATVIQLGEGAHSMGNEPALLIYRLCEMHADEEILLPHSILQDPRLKYYIPAWNMLNDATDLSPNQDGIILQHPNWRGSIALGRALPISNIQQELQKEYTEALYKKGNNLDLRIPPLREFSVVSRFEAGKVYH